MSDSPVLVNGFPKSGTHALVKGCQLLGLLPANDQFEAGRVMLGHFPHPGPFPRGTQHLHIIRHPRNCLISMCRFKGMPVTTGFLLGHLQRYGEHGPMAALARGFLPWLSVPTVHTLRYEDLMASDAALRGVAAFLDLPYLEDAFANLPGLTMTWTGSPSRWEDHWNADLDRAWVDSGMADVQARLGY
jgi:hypothetical protein